MSYKSFIPLILFLCALTISMAQEPPLWLRYANISPDGEKIVFAYKGDLFLVNSDGGQATPLTVHSARDYMPEWSPDGSMITFASDRFGNYDIFTIPAEGGLARRLTSFSGSEYPSGFTPDGDKILYTASIQDNPENVLFPSGILSELYSIDIRTREMERMISTPAEQAKMDTAGNLIVYQDRKGYENAWRKHHNSSVTRDIRLYDKNNGTHRKLSTFAGEDRDPVFAPDQKHIYYLSEQFGDMNVCRMSIDDPSNIEQITFYENHPVRFLSVSNDGTLCYSWNGEIYTKNDNEQPRKVVISIALEEKENSVEFEEFTKGATEMAVSPSGKEIALIIRGEVFVTSTDYKTTKRITNTPGQERSVSFSPDGKKLLYASERNESWNIYQTSLIREEEELFALSTILKEEPVMETTEETFQPLYSPDGKEVAFLEERTTLKVINLETREIRTILEGRYNYSYVDGDQWFQWAPDGKWFLVTYSPHHVFLNEAGLVSASGNSEVINLTRSGYSDSRPKWVLDGKAMLWFSDRNGLRSHGSWGSQRDEYAMFFDKEAWDKFNLSEEEYKLMKEEEKEKKKDNQDDEDDEEKDDEKYLVDPLDFDLENIEDRVKRLTIHSSSLSDAVLSKDGEKLYYLSRFEKGYDLWVHKIRENETKKLLDLKGSGGRIVMDKKGKNLFVFTSGKAYKISTGDKPKKEQVSYKAEMHIDKPQERAYMFEHVWRQVKKKFYDPDLHDVDWDFYKKEYIRFLPHINNNYDFAEMLSEMLGELNASHTGAGYRPKHEGKDETASLAIFFEVWKSGEGIEILEIIDKSPLIQSDSRIEKGTVIEKINNQEVGSWMEYYELLNHMEGKNTLLSLYNHRTEERWEETIKPISRGKEYNLLYERWVKNRRAETDSLSEGRIGYVHVRGMNSSSFRDVYSEVLGRLHDKEALIVDTRFNGGGWLHDDLATLLDGRRYVDFYPRGRFYGSDPMNKWIKPSVVLISESNYSDAHGFPYAYKTLGIGKLVGMPVPGTMTAVWWERLQDNTLTFGIPQVGTKDLQGNYLENQQLEPDVRVIMDYDVATQGRDQQLEKAVEVLLMELD